ncbi:MAG: DUF4329 domain-containing protein [Pseudomonadota bacterium]
MLLAIAPGKGFAQGFTEAEMIFIKIQLAEVQNLSLDRNREFCGYFGYVDGALTMSRVKRGRKASCRAFFPGSAMDVVASFHTHGRFDLRYFSEIPSTNDILADQIEGVNGFMVTPGGRLWFIDSTAGTGTLLCGLGCLPQDPDFHRDPDIQIKSKFTFQELALIEGK